WVPGRPAGCRWRCSPPPPAWSPRSRRGPHARLTTSRWNSSAARMAWPGLRRDIARRTRHMITGKTQLIAHLGYPTEAFKAPMIYNPWFESQGIDAVVVPMGVKPDDYPATLTALARLTNLRGALVTMPHKVSTLSLASEVPPTARIAGACNALLRRADGSWLGDQFDGAGFVRGVQRKGRRL